MSNTASAILKQARSWIGCNEADGSHKKIIDTYNSHKPLARGYKLKYTDSWCAGYVSAVAIACKATDIIPTECGCQKMIDLFKKIGCWIEDESVTPKPGWVIFYDWQDDGKGDNTGWSDHVGYVEEVKDGLITVIEGNYDNRVQRRNIRVNYKYIRGYGVPKYDAEPAEKPAPATVTVKLEVLSMGSTGEQVEALQRILASYGYNLGSKNPFDGKFGQMTEDAVKAFQKAHGLKDDGIVGAKTWAALLGV